MEELTEGNSESDVVDTTAPPKREDQGCCSPWKWFTEEPRKRWRFLIFLICGCFTLIWFMMYVAIPEDPRSYVFSGLVVMIMSGWALNHFRILTKLTEQVDRVYRLNRDFAEENRKITNDVMILTKTEQHLCGIQMELKDANKRLKANVLKFQQLDKNLRTIADSNIKGIERIQSKSRLVVDSMTTSLIRNEKALLHTVYEALAWDNNMSGLDRSQFNMFWKKLPKSYYQRWLKCGKTYDDIAGENGILDYRKFRQMVDEFSRKEALSGGSK
eukprot:253811_1